MRRIDFYSAVIALRVAHQRKGKNIMFTFYNNPKSYEHPEKYYSLAELIECQEAEKAEKKKDELNRQIADFEYSLLGEEEFNPFAALLLQGYLQTKDPADYQELCKECPNLDTIVLNLLTIG